MGMVIQPHRIEVVQACEELSATGLGYVEIATRLGLTKNTVAGILFRYRQRIFDTVPKGVAAIDERLRWEMINAGGCRWVIGTPGPGGPGAGEWHWCGEKLSRPGAPYCTAHEALTRHRQ